MFDGSATEFQDGSAFSRTLDGHELVVVRPLVGTAPVISSRSTLRKNPPGRIRATCNRRWRPRCRRPRRSQGSGRRRIVGIVGNDEDAFFGLGAHVAVEAAAKTMAAKTYRILDHSLAYAPGSVRLWRMRDNKLSLVNSFVRELRAACYGRRPAAPRTPKTHSPNLRDYHRHMRPTRRPAGLTAGARRAPGPLTCTPRFTSPPHEGLNENLRHLPEDYELANFAGCGRLFSLIETNGRPASRPEWCSMELENSMTRSRARSGCFSRSIPCMCACMCAADGLRLRPYRQCAAGDRVRLCSTGCCGTSMASITCATSATSRMWTTRSTPGGGARIEIRQLTEETYANFKADVAALGCLPPDVEPRATEHIER